MGKVTDKTDESNSESQARAKLEHIMAMVARLKHAGEYGNGEENGPDGECELAYAVILDGIGEYRLDGDNSGHWTEERAEDYERYHDQDGAGEAIQNSALSVLVRSDWYEPGTEGGHRYYRDDSDRSRTTPAVNAASEYELLLCTGGPAVRIRGELSEYGEPTTATIEHQDWGTPWTEYRPLVCGDGAHGYGWLASPSPECHDVRVDTDALDALLAYASVFYYGEG